jgi:hypothetical protein
MLSSIIQQCPHLNWKRNTTPWPIIEFKKQLPFKSSASFTFQACPTYKTTSFFNILQAGKTVAFQVTLVDVMFPDTTIMLPTIIHIHIHIHIHIYIYIFIYKSLPFNDEQWGWERTNQSQQCICILTDPLFLCHIFMLTLIPPIDIVRTNQHTKGSRFKSMLVSIKERPALVSASGEQTWNGCCRPRSSHSKPIFQMTTSGSGR